METPAKSRFSRVGIILNVTSAIITIVVAMANVWKNPALLGAVNKSISLPLWFVAVIVGVTSATIVYVSQRFIRAAELQNERRLAEMKLEAEKKRRDDEKQQFHMMRDYYDAYDRMRGYETLETK